MHYLFIYLFICWSYRMAALTISIAPCTYKVKTSASATFSSSEVYILLADWFIGRPK